MNATVCRMRESIGEVELCRERCPLRDATHCALDHVDFRSRPSLARFLLGLRGDLEEVRTNEERDSARRDFFRRMNAGRCD